MRTFSGILLVFALCLLLAPVSADSVAAAAESKNFDWGGDIRLRGINFDNIPISVDPPGITRGGKNVFFRGRTRLWGQLSISDYVLFKARLVNEFRSYETGRGANSYDFPDEFVLDHLYLDFKDLLDGKLDLRIGRQDLIYGTGKVILDGNPLDGSRTIYFNAIKGSLKWEKTVLDILGIWNKAEDELALNSQHRDLVGILGRIPTDMVESGGGLYLKNKSIEKMPLEAYYLYKNESDHQWTEADGVVHTQPNLDLHTLGLRLMPKLTDRFSGNLEAAGQLGERGEQDVNGWMVDAKLSYKFPVSEKISPSASVGVYQLSGDDPDTTDEDEGWNPLWSRWPQYSELYVYGFDADGAGRWSNVTMPYVGLDVPFSSKVSLNLLAGYMFAPESSANIPGSDDERGFLGTAWLKFKLNDTWSGHLLGEVVEPGDYYNVDDTAHFVRFEMMCVF